MPLTPLEPWILERVGYKTTSSLTPRQAIERYQLARLRETLAFVKQASLFYRRQLAGIESQDLESLESLAQLPFTRPSDLQEDPLAFLCVPQGRIKRVVTLASSGTTAPPKRIFFTGEDLEHTVDFFHHGMGTLVRPGERVLVLMPGEQPGTVGDLLDKALARLGASTIVHGLVQDVPTVLRLIVEQAIDCLVGLPVQVLALVRHPDAEQVLPGRLKTILLSADYVPDAIVTALTECWRVPVFNHYGLTETGLGGGVECACRCGYHLREADLLWEVVDPQTGGPLPPGHLGETVFTTLKRTGMPLIRYRTGDLARFLPGPCPCGSMLHRMERVQGRLASLLRLQGGEPLGMAALDEALFPLPFMLDFRPSLSRSGPCEILTLDFKGTEPRIPGREAAIRRSLLGIPAIAQALACGRLVLGSIREAQLTPVSGSVKRTIVDMREVLPC